MSPACLGDMSCVLFGHAILICNSLLQTMQRTANMQIKALQHELARHTGSAPQHAQGKLEGHSNPPTSRSEASHRYLHEKHVLPWHDHDAIDQSLQFKFTSVFPA